MEEKLYRLVKGMLKTVPTVMLILAMIGFISQVINGSVAGMLFYVLVFAVFINVAKMAERGE